MFNIASVPATSHVISHLLKIDVLVREGFRRIIGSINHASHYPQKENKELPSHSPSLAPREG